jgi:hypothetical protein
MCIIYFFNFIEAAKVAIVIIKPKYLIDKEFSEKKVQIRESE